MRFIYILIMALSVSACATPPIVLDVGAQTVKVGKDNPSDNFEDIGSVVGSHGTSCGAYGYLGTYEGAVADLKNQANKMKANYVQIFTITEPHFHDFCADNLYKITGTAYRKVRELPSPVPIVEQKKSQSASEKLAELKSLRSQNLISAEEYEKLRQEILSHAF